MSDRAVVQIPVTLDAANRRKDRSASLRFSSTQELGTADFAELDRLTPSGGWLLFAQNELMRAIYQPTMRQTMGSVLRNACVPSYSFGGVRTPISQSRSLVLDPALPGVRARGNCGAWVHATVPQSLQLLGPNRGG